MITSLKKKMVEISDGSEVQTHMIEDILTKLRDIEQRLTSIETDVSLKSSCVPYLPANVDPTKKIVQITPGRYYIFKKPSDHEIDKLRSWKLL